MTITRPSTARLSKMAENLGFEISPAEAEDYLAVMQGAFDAYDLIDSLPDNVPIVRYPRTPGVRPSPADNPTNAWYCRTDIKGALHGRLHGKTVALKDNIALAGVPMMVGSSTLEGYVPNIDATVVTRVLDEGATVIGKVVCESFCMSGASFTSHPVPVHNPHRHGHCSGGSSSGAAVVVALGEADIAIGGDQGGSIRIPASLCGVYGMKPTHGLVPYSGIMPVEATLDHAGPITANVADNALALEVLAGSDGLDPRQYSPKVDRYTDALDRGVAGLRIGVLSEGFTHANMESGVIESVWAGARTFERLGAQIEEVSIVEHGLAAAAWMPIGCEGLLAQMMNGNGAGMNYKGLYNVGLIDAHASWRQRADDLSASLKFAMLIGHYGLTHYRGRFYAKAQNLRRSIKAAYDAAFERYDLLLMPTVPTVARAFPAADASVPEYISAAIDMLANTSPFDVTGHPAMSLPCGRVDGLPVGLMLVGGDYQESKIYQAAAAFERSGHYMGS